MARRKQQAIASPRRERRESHGKHTRKRKAEAFECVLIGEFSGSLDAWNEHLCLERNADGTLTLSCRGYEYLGELRDYTDEDGEVTLPPEIDGKAVRGSESGYIVGEKLVLQVDDAYITVSADEVDIAADWLKSEGMGQDTWFRRGMEADQVCDLRSAARPVVPPHLPLTRPHAPMLPGPWMPRATLRRIYSVAAVPLLRGSACKSRTSRSNALAYES
jgi:hypothetical protein